MAPDAWGGTANAAYNAGAAANDRHFSIYRTNFGETSYLLARFRNAAGHPLTAIHLVYDFEAAWVRFDPSSPRTAAFVVQYATDNVTWVEMPGFGGEVSNANAPAATTWLTDEQMDADCPN